MCVLFLKTLLLYKMGLPIDCSSSSSITRESLYYQKRVAVWSGRARARLAFRRFSLNNKTTDRDRQRGDYCVSNARVRSVFIPPLFFFFLEESTRVRSQNEDRFFLLRRVSTCGILLVCPAT